MPISPHLKPLYPKNWPEIRAKILTRANHRCESCGIPNYAIRWKEGGQAITGGHSSFQHAVAMAEELDAGLRAWREDVSIVVLTTAHHPDPDPRNNDPANLHAWCQRCHNAADAEMRRKNARKTRRNRRALSDLPGIDEGPG